MLISCRGPSQRKGHTHEIEPVHLQCVSATTQVCVDLHSTHNFRASKYVLALLDEQMADHDGCKEEGGQ